MTEWQDDQWLATGPKADGRGSGPLRPSIPLLDDDGRVLLEPGEARLGALPATDVQFHVRVGQVDHRWGPLDVRVSLTSHRAVLVATPGVPNATLWFATNSAPLVLRAIEPPQTRRGDAPVRVAGHVRWDFVTCVVTDGSRVQIVMPVSADGEASLVMHVPAQLGHRLASLARRAFVAAGRPLTIDTPVHVAAALAPPLEHP